MRRYLHERDEEQTAARWRRSTTGNRRRKPLHRRPEAVRAGTPASGHRSTRQWVPHRHREGVAMSPPPAP